MTLCLSRALPMKMTLYATVTLALAVCSIRSAERRDIVLFNGKIFTADPERPYAEAIALRGDTILSCGTKAEMRKVAGESADLIDLNGGTILPGFADSHTHPIESGSTLTG